MTGLEWDGPVLFGMAESILLRRAVLVGVGLVLALGVALAALPKWFEVSDPPQQTDCAVVMLGGDLRARMDQAANHLERGLSDTILVPACGLELNPDMPPDTASLLASIQGCSTKERFAQSPWFVEQTWIEISLLKKMVKERGITSMTIISHPGHMRRIRIMTGAIFQGSSPEVRLLPARPMHGLDWKTSLRASLRETAKIMWYFLTRPILNPSEGQA